MSISTLLNQIDKGDIVLPAIQRDFVWPEEKVLMLLDSIMRGYPLGIVLMWETYEDLRYRHFTKDFRSDNKFTYSDNIGHRKLLVVLDGQQRLQSLHIALYGTYEGKLLHFDVLSGEGKEDLREMAYVFEFCTREENEALNAQTLEQIKNKQDGDEYDELEWWICFQDLFRYSHAEKITLRKELAKKLGLSEEQEDCLEMNLARVDEVMTKEEGLLKTTIIDENKPLVSPDRKTEADVLEIFVRVNRQGTPLNRSDLIFSMLKLDWKDSAESLPDFVDSINEGNSFDLNTDFVIRCLFAVSDLGSKLDIDKLRNKRHIQTFKANFEQCCNAIRALVDVVQGDCWISNSKAFGGVNTFVPFVYYLFHLPGHQIPNNQIEPFRKALFLSGFGKVFSRFADSRIGKIIGWEMAPRLKKRDYDFPLDAFIKWVTKSWFKVDTVGPDLLQNNIYLTHCLVQGRSGDKTKLRSSSLEMDHIFPRAKLRSKGFENHEYNHFANFWLLAKDKNQNKSAKDPKKYFADVNDQDLARAFIDREMLTYSQFNKFLRVREERLVGAVQNTLGFELNGFE